MDECRECNQIAEHCDCILGFYGPDNDISDIWSEPAPDNVIYVDFVAKRRVA